MSHAGVAGANGDYERPQQPWICGWARDGAACIRGPDAQGRCHALADCMPLQLDGVWKCNRSPSRGGPCETGPCPDGSCARQPLPCSPIQSLRQSRQRWVLAGTASCVALVALTLASPWRNEVLAPGPLARAHAHLAREESTGRCASCHAAGADGLADWTLSALGVVHTSGPSQSELCMGCHRANFDPRFSLAAHTCEPRQLLRSSTSSAIDQIPAAYRAEVLRQAADVSHPIAESQVWACARCHREHQGANHDLKAISDQQCHLCHQQQFHSFANGHPDFDNWPHDRRTRIIFDHRTHAARHFPARQQSFACQTCHLESSPGHPQRTVSYAACASCHDEGIANSLQAPLEFVSLPSLDTVALRREKIDVGAWPAQLSGEFDGQISPLLYLMLWGDPLGRIALQHLGVVPDLLHVDAHNLDDLEAVGDLVWAIKRFLLELQQDGRQAVARRATQISSGSLSSEQLRWLAHELPIAALQAAIVEKFPGLERELSRFGSAAEPELGIEEALHESGNATYRGVPFGQAAANETRWLVSDDTLEVQLLAHGHGNATLASWIDLAASLPVHEGVLHELLRPTGHGECTSCHSLEDGSSRAVTAIVNWVSVPDGRSDHRGFTKFSHAPHLMQPTLKDCRACHVLDEDANYLATYRELSPEASCGNFRSMDRVHCATCHSARGAGDHCTQCHYYHQRFADRSLDISFFPEL